jgi:hypothetical protein
MENIRRFQRIVDELRISVEVRFVSACRCLDFEPSERTGIRLEGILNDQDTRANIVSWHAYSLVLSGIGIKR